MSSPSIQFYSQNISHPYNTPYITTTTTVGCGTTTAWGNFIQPSDLCFTCLVGVDKDSDETLYVQRSWHCSIECFYQFLLNSLSSLSEMPQDG